MATKNMPSEIKLNVLGYQDDGEWVALALEMDLRGYGKTFAQAQEELHDLIGAQFSFAAHKGQPDLLWRRAERKYWKMFEDAKRARIQSLALGIKAPQPYKIAGMPVPDAHVIAEFAKARHLEA